jgi:hypothetical protein
MSVRIGSANLRVSAVLRLRTARSEALGRFVWKQAHALPTGWWVGLCWAAWRGTAQAACR